MASQSIEASIAWSFSLMASGGGACRFIGMRNGRGIRYRRNIWGSSTPRKKQRQKRAAEPFATAQGKKGSDIGSQKQNYFCAGLVRARKTRSSMATLRVKSVGVAALETPTACAELEIAGQAGLPCSELVSPGTTEIRVVLGVHEPVAPKQVSRTKIWRKPLLGVPADLAGYFEDVTDRKAMKRPEELTEGRRLSFPESAPASSMETRVVCGAH